MGVCSEETRKKISEALKGRPSPMKGGHLTEEHKRKISEARKGRVIISDKQREMARVYRQTHPMPKEHYERLSVMFKGRQSPMKGRHQTEETKKKIGAWGKGRVYKPETLLKLSEQRRGEKGSNWKGGISFEPYCEKFNDEFKERVRAFFGYICVECETPQNGKKLCVHHVNFNKQACCDEIIPPRFVPLCQSCHGISGGNKRDYWEQHFTEMIMGYYEGRCFLTREEYKALVVI